MSILLVLVKKCICHATKGVKRIFFFQLLVSFDYREPIPDDAIVKLKIILN